MITIKNKAAIRKMEEAGRLLCSVFDSVAKEIKAGCSTLDLDLLIANALQKKGLVSKSKGYKGYRFSSCISVDDVVVHGVPSSKVVLSNGNLIKIDICASYQGYCADMARCFFVGDSPPSADINRLVTVAQQALDEGIKMALPGNHVSDISSAIQKTIDAHGFGIVRDFAGHGIGKNMHEDPEVLNYGVPGKGPLLRPGMALAIEPMITLGKHDVYIDTDGWTVKTRDSSVAAHVEDTIIITESTPKIITRDVRKG